MCLALRVLILCVVELPMFLADAGMASSLANASVLRKPGLMLEWRKMNHTEATILYLPREMTRFSLLIVQSAKGRKVEKQPL